MRRAHMLGVLAATVALVGAGCGGDDDDTTTEAAAETTAAVAETTEELADTTEEAVETTGGAVDTTEAEAEVAETTEAATDTTAGAATGAIVGAMPAPEISADLSGDIVVSGSSTVEPISLSVAEGFGALAPGVTITVDGPGTGDGFRLLCAGEIDVQDASRAISDEEVAECEAAGIEYVELLVGFDGITVVTNPADDWQPDCYTKDQLVTLWGPDAEGTVTTWDQVDPSFPAEPITLVAPGEESGTFDFFIEETLGEDDAEEQILPRADYQSSGSDTVIGEGIAGTQGSLGYFGFAFFEQFQDSVRAHALDYGEGCVDVTFETIADGSYPLSRPLYIYVNTASLAENPALAPFVQYYLSEDGLASVAGVGYVPLPDYTDTAAAFPAAG